MKTRMNQIYILPLIKAQQKVLKSVTGPKIFAVKIGCPVMLIKNFCKTLVNDLQDVVKEAEAEKI